MKNQLEKVLSAGKPAIYEMYWLGKCGPPLIVLNKRRELMAQVSRRGSRG
jgi:hypothetical protein